MPPEGVCRKSTSDMARILLGVGVALALEIWCVVELGKVAPDESETVGRALVMVENSTGDAGARTEAAAVNAIAVGAVFVAMAALLLGLHRGRCYKVLNAWLCATTLLILSFLGWFIFDLACASQQIPYDTVTCGVILWNFGAVGVVSLNLGAGHPVVRRGYLIATAVIVSWFLTRLPEWTTWGLLGLMAAYDCYAVYGRYGIVAGLLAVEHEATEPAQPSSTASESSYSYGRRGSVESSIEYDIPILDPDTFLPVAPAVLSAPHMCAAAGVLSSGRPAATAKPTRDGRVETSGEEIGNPTSNPLLRLRDAECTDTERKAAELAQHLQIGGLSANPSALVAEPAKDRQMEECEGETSPPKSNPLLRLRDAECTDTERKAAKLAQDGPHLQIDGSSANPSALVPEPAKDSQLAKCEGVTNTPRSSPLLMLREAECTDTERREAVSQSSGQHARSAQRLQTASNPDGDDGPPAPLLSLGEIGSNREFAPADCGHVPLGKNGLSFPIHDRAMSEERECAASSTSSSPAPRLEPGHVADVPHSGHADSAAPKPPASRGGSVIQPASLLRYAVAQQAPAHCIEVVAALAREELREAKLKQPAAPIARSTFATDSGRHPPLCAAGFGDRARDTRGAVDTSPSSFQGVHPGSSKLLRDDGSVSDSNGDHDNHLAALAFASGGNGDEGLILGLGDFIFYCLVVGRVVQSSEASVEQFTAVFSSVAALLFGLQCTLSYIAVTDAPVPALPLPIALAVAAYFMSSSVTVPYYVFLCAP
ncbi:Presenilin-A [Diplonema papillatum]|nr:Presenilin-A [Diplonema papillatum]